MNMLAKAAEFAPHVATPTLAKVRLADYIAQRIAEHGVRHVFMLTGGGAMHLNDALGRAQGLEYVCFHHEQAAAMRPERRA